MKSIFEYLINRQTKQKQEELDLNNPHKYSLLKWSNKFNSFTVHIIDNLFFRKTVTGIIDALIVKYIFAHEYKSVLLSYTKLSGIDEESTHALLFDADNENFYFICETNTLFHILSYALKKAAGRVHIIFTLTYRDYNLSVEDPDYGKILYFNIDVSRQDQQGLYTHIENYLKQAKDEINK